MIPMKKMMQQLHKSLHKCKGCHISCVLYDYYVEKAMVHDSQNPRINHTNTKGKLSGYILVSKIWQEPPFSLKKGGSGRLLEGLTPPLENKGGSRYISSNSCQEKIPAEIPTGQYR
jgi:hypothetical protein